MPSPGDYAALLADAGTLSERLVSLRRMIHSHPELGFTEERTAAIGADLLCALGLEVRRGVGLTGVMGLLRGPEPGPCLLLRADMDALPVQEETAAPYASARPGVMHACGHDAHVAMLLGAAELLAARRHRLKGTVKFILQPAEEILGGARAMITDGVLADPAPDAAFALHVDPLLDAGLVGITPGPAMAATDHIEIAVLGNSSHAALPHLGIDAIAASGQVISAVHAIVSRRLNPFATAVIHLGTISGGRAFNIVADRVVMKGTVRTLDETLRQRLPELIRSTAEFAAAAHGATASLNYEQFNPTLFNDPALCALATAATSDLFGAGAVTAAPSILGGEDFAMYLDGRPGCFIRLGCRNEAKGCIHPWHHPRFDLDETVLPNGAALLAAIACRYLA